MPAPSRKVTVRSDLVPTEPLNAPRGPPSAPSWYCLWALMSTYMPSSRNPFLPCCPSKCAANAKSVWVTASLNLTSPFVMFLSLTAMSTFESMSQAYGVKLHRQSVAPAGPARARAIVAIESRMFFLMGPSLPSVHGRGDSPPAIAARSGAPLRARHSLTHHYDGKDRPLPPPHGVGKVKTHLPHGTGKGPPG